MLAHCQLPIDKHGEVTDDRHWIDHILANVTDSAPQLHQKFDVELNHRIGLGGVELQPLIGTPMTPWTNVGGDVAFLKQKFEEKNNDTNPCSWR